MDSLSNRNLPFQEEHQIYQDQIERFAQQELLPNDARWDDQGYVDREAWLKAGANGLLCPSMPEEYGGPGGDFLHSVLMMEGLARHGLTGPGFFIHSEMVTPYIINFGSDEQKARWLPGMATGEVIGAIAMTEPGAGSDLRSMRTNATRTDGGWLLNGQKVFISNGQTSDLVVVAAKTDLADKNSITLFLVDTKSKGFQRGRNLEKIGIHGQDTSELFFEDVFVPDDSVLGKPGEGFKQLMHGLARERLSIAIGCQSKAESALQWTIDYVEQREMFGARLADMQNTRFTLAEMKTDVEVGRAFVDDMLRQYLDGKLDATRASMGKLWLTEMLGRVADKGLQMHGGWGYMREFPISRVWVAARIERILGGSNEVMKEIIGRSLVGRGKA
ncbi:acyl-CoA dehydrogenase family protein [Diaphorobacter aerolatus]|uniref:Acyl-CoA dehydrogenase family protein n=1 Tax=Diaphorobacter aerolatus TaxID=1288495 RepID=A0A7H0GH51_9BURK|nr:acyl-CoA dehydrogenase family protein [Diaphorobacter aerolatus]QNP47617.1 acyl-CoA dehydrogenase family protein [Diaphorobacter aerolatus]